MKIRKIFSILIFLLLLCFQAPVWADPDPSLRWDFTGQETFGIDKFNIFNVSGSPAIGDDGSIYAGSSNGYFFGIRPDGWLKWVIEDWGAFFFTPAIADNGIIYTHNNFYLLALDPDDGSVRWSYGPICKFWGAPAIGQDGTVYIGSSLGRLYAFTPYLEKKWEYTGFGNPDQPGCYSNFVNPVIGPDGTIYCVREGGPVDALGNPHKDSADLHALRPDGSLIWGWTDNHLTPFTPPAIAGGRLYVSGDAARLYAFHTVDGSINRETSPLMNWAEDSSGGPVIGPHGTVYVPNGDVLYAFPPNLAEPQWSWDTNSDNTELGLQISTPAVGTDGNIYFGTWGNLGETAHTGELCVMTPGGSLDWHSGLLAGHIYSSPAIVPSGNQGVLYIGLRDAVRAWNVDAPGLAKSPWPCDRANLKRNARASYSIIRVLSELMVTVKAYNFPHNFGNSLESKLSAAIQSLEKEKVTPAKNQLGAFINEVSALKGKQIMARDADSLITSAQRIRDFL